jgi:hypothetical protein
LQDLKTAILIQSSELGRNVYISNGYGPSDDKEKLVAKIFAIYAILKAT